MTSELLKQVEANTLKPKEAYQKIYQEKRPVHRYRRAHCVKMRIIIPDEKGVTLFLRVLFALPIPILLIRPFLKMAVKKGSQGLGDIDMDDISKLISTKGVSINVRSNDGVIVKIKTI
jgi:hypothetical protein